MQTLQTNHMPSTMSTTTTTTFSNNSGHRRMGSSELDVFEASRYFSGDMDSLPLGFGSWSTSTKKNNYNINKKKSLELIPTQHQQQEEALLIDHEKQNKLEKKRASSCKSLNSPTAKLANYLNSFLLQRSSKKKSINSKSNNKNMQSLKKVDDHDHDHHLNHHESISFRSYSDCNKSYSSCVFGTPISQAQAAGGIGERRTTRTISNNCIERRINGAYYIMKKVGDEVEVEDDGESDSSSDLFELRNMEDIGDGPNDLPVYGTTSFEVAIASAVLL